MFVFFFVLSFFFFFKQKTAYEMRISDWSSDVCSSDLVEVDRSGFDLQLMGAFYHRKVAELNLQLYAYYLDERDSLGFQTRNRKVWTPGMRLSREAQRGQMDFEFEGILQAGPARPTASGRPSRRARGLPSAYNSVDAVP